MIKNILAMTLLSFLLSGCLLTVSGSSTLYSDRIHTNVRYKAPVRIHKPVYHPRVHRSTQTYKRVPRVSSRHITERERQRKLLLLQRMRENERRAAIAQRERLRILQNSRSRYSTQRTR